MDTARQFIPMAPVCTVTADQVVHDFQGDIPAGVKFCCPSCDRPVQFHRGSKGFATSAHCVRKPDRHSSQKSTEPLISFCSPNCTAAFPACEERPSRQILRTVSSKHRSCLTYRSSISADDGYIEVNAVEEDR